MIEAFVIGVVVGVLVCLQEHLRVKILILVLEIDLLEDVVLQLPRDVICVGVVEPLRYLDVLECLHISVFLNLILVVRGDKEGHHLHILDLEDAMST